MQTKDAAQYAIGMRGSREFVAAQIANGRRIFAMAIMRAIVGRKRQMVNQIEDMKNKIDELSEMAKKKSDENESLKAENKALKQRIKDLDDVCDGGYLSDYKPQLAEDDDISLFNYECIKQWESGSKLKKKIAELQDQHQQDCIRINDLTTTVHVLAGLYSTLRKNVGMD